ncbi:MTA/SAH nucleosidase [Treponema primitia ZAS-2]|uniref:5'-methylthioadenosine/S-adenosylhomocysteine nucleosidase n=1 Tax=Treponema primitia (strain ATCC BAA-887 / DSM 12427 / ZAS-2) TaxID=545694 RepID=F5YLR4_TREPZ|nr:5'-methylthioadenosine/S-adenosylhomocysteine nucleosidase [Treponema primitia]AEF84132.1 MTA/SAH nucleosidase [Treponema primitia ZAS-2]
MIGIIGAMEEEISLLRSALEDSRLETIGGYKFYIGKLENKPVALLLCGIGKVSAAVGCALLIDHYHPELVINTGSAGGIDPALSFGDAIISDGLVYYDADVTAFNYALGQIPGMPPIFPVTEDLIRRAEAAVDSLKREGILPENFNHCRGLIGSADIFMHEPEMINELRKRFPTLRAVEMEGAAIAQACYIFKVPGLIIRALSDIAGTESPVTHDQFLPIASKHSGEIVRRIVREW